MNRKVFADPIKDAKMLGRLGERLLDKGLLTRRQIQYALQKQDVESLRFGSLLIKYGLVREFDVAQELASDRGLPFLASEEFPNPDPETLKHFNRELCLHNGFLPISRDEDKIDVLIGDGDDRNISELVMSRTGLRCRFAQGEFSVVSQYIREVYYFAQNPIDSLLAREIRRLSNDVDHAYSPEKFLDYLLHKAVRERATDIHMSPSQNSLHLFFRIDGVLSPIMALPISLSRLINFIKLTAEMDISEQRRPQDGSFHMVILEMPFAIRVSIIYGEFGERAVLRLLPERSRLHGLGQLGFLDDAVDRLQRIFSRPSGMVLVTGPTGSGKTTTLHAALRLQSLVESNVLTVEDPIEYRVPGTAQTEVNRRAGYDFSNALRYFLRHDPDVILIGEIRDKETALAAVEAAATGHLVLSTLHVSNVFGVINRLQPLGLDAQQIADNLIAVVSQLLIRRNCQHCSVEVQLTEEEEKWLGGKAMARKGEGCEICTYTGYYGRLPVYEIMEITEELAFLIESSAGREALQHKAKELGFTSLIDQAKWRVRNGQTTIEEIIRIIGEAPD